MSKSDRKRENKERVRVQERERERESETQTDRGREREECQGEWRRALEGAAVEHDLELAISSACDSLALGGENGEACAAVLHISGRDKRIVIPWDLKRLCLLEGSLPHQKATVVLRKLLPSAPPQVLPRYCYRIYIYIYIYI